MDSVEQWPIDDFSDLSALPPRRSDYESLAVIGGSTYDDGLYAHAYLESARVVASHWINLRVDDALPIAIYGLYRHAIELALKCAVRATAACLQTDGDPDPGLESDVLELFLGRSHKIGHLADRLNQYLSRLKVSDEEKRLDAQTQATLDWIDALDATGQTFRYSSVKGGKGQGRVKALPNQVHVDFDADLRRMDDAAWMLTAGFGGWIDAHAEAQADYYSDMAASSDYY